jgi:predicted nucleic acid-binding protein
LRGKTVARVVDASALAALLFGESEADAVAARLADARLFAPALLLFELGNVCLNKIRRNPSQRAHLLATFNLASDHGIETVDVDHAEVLNLADRTGLTAYDATYLWLAKHLGAELVTLDKKLIRAGVAESSS